MIIIMFIKEQLILEKKLFVTPMYLKVDIIKQIKSIWLINKKKHCLKINLIDCINVGLVKKAILNLSALKFDVTQR